MAYGIWSIAFGKKYYFLPEADLVYGLQQPEFVLGKNFFTQNSFYVWHRTFQVLLSERKKSSFLFPYVEIFWTL